MKITFEKEDYKVVRIIKAQPGDIFIKDTEGINDNDEKVQLLIPFPVAFKLYAKRKITVGKYDPVKLLLAYHSDFFGSIEYADVFCFGNYDQYKKLMILIGKEPKSFMDYIKGVVQDEGFDTSLWPEDFKK